MKKPKNIPTYYKSAGTPIYRDTTALPFAVGGPLHDRDINGKLLQSTYASALGNMFREGGPFGEDQGVFDYATSIYASQPGNYYAQGGMIKRADGSYSPKGLWDNIRANKGSGKEPTKEMLAQERKIAREYRTGGQFPRPYSLPEDSFKQGGTNLHNSVYASSSAPYPGIYANGGVLGGPGDPVNPVNWNKVRLSNDRMEKIKVIHGNDIFNNYNPENLLFYSLNKDLVDNTNDFTSYIDPLNTHLDRTTFANPKNTANIKNTLSRKGWALDTKSGAMLKMPPELIELYLQEQEPIILKPRPAEQIALLGNQPSIIQPTSSKRYDSNTGKWVVEPSIEKNKIEDTYNKARWEWAQKNKPPLQQLDLKGETFAEGGTLLPPDNAPAGTPFNLANRNSWMGNYGMIPQGHNLSLPLSSLPGIGNQITSGAATANFKTVGDYVTAAENWERNQAGSPIAPGPVNINTVIPSTPSIPEVAKTNYYTDPYTGQVVKDFNPTTGVATPREIPSSFGNTQYANYLEKVTNSPAAKENQQALEAERLNNMELLKTMTPEQKATMRAAGLTPAQYLADPFSAGANKFAEGGMLGGPGGPEPIYVDNPKDPRIKAYQKALEFYKNSNLSHIGKGGNWIDPEGYIWTSQYPMADNYKPLPKSPQPVVYRNTDNFISFTPPKITDLEFTPPEPETQWTNPTPWNDVEPTKKYPKLYLPNYRTGVWSATGKINPNQKEKELKQLDLKGQTFANGGSILSMSNTPQLEGEGKDLTYPDGAYVYGRGGVIKSSQLFADGGPIYPTNQQLAQFLNPEYQRVTQGQEVTVRPSSAQKLLIDANKRAEVANKNKKFTYVDPVSNQKIEYDSKQDFINKQKRNLSTGKTVINQGDEIVPALGTALEFTGVPAGLRTLDRLKENPLALAKNIGTTAYDLAALPQNLAYEGANYLFGNNKFNLPIDTEALSVTADAAGILPFIPKGISKAIKQGAKMIGTESGLLSNAYKLNPYAFKPNPNSAYRMIGDEKGLASAVESGYLQPTTTGSDIGKVHNAVHYQIGAPSDTRKYFGRTWSRGYKGPYMAEVPNAATDIRFAQGPGGKEMGADVWTYPDNYIPSSEAKLYKQDWVQGYKEVPKQLPGSPNKSVVTAENTQNALEAPKGNMYGENQVLVQQQRLLNPDIKAKFFKNQAPEFTPSQPTNSLFDFEKTPKDFGNRITPKNYEDFVNRIHGSTDYDFAASAGKNPGNLGVGNYNRPGKVFKDAPLNNLGKDIINAHEKNHGMFAGTLSAEMSDDLLRPFGTKKVIPHYQDKHQADEVLSRMAQFKNALGMGDNQTFTLGHLNLIRKNYANSFIDNGITEMLKKIKPGSKGEQEFLKNMNKYAFGSAPFIIGGSYLGNKFLQNNGLDQHPSGQFKMGGQTRVVKSSQLFNR